ncbi:hypothetical protein P43SY_006344 [Pythium insidiosum]|uniref:Deacetylase sirtuin-type domain-containing protein n=1 Tax=Pythium insidiosum TaxID=114742 RepID=A0AAD5Q7B5_PYTIN|nr:hypothetical protein P43SY_006344 [Pythium insidiosum]
MMSSGTTTMDDGDALRRAAEKIAAADVILLAAGAGFSADSGLPVYNDIAAVEAYEAQGLEYQDLCDPYWLESDEEIFYGFWGSCVNAYRDTRTHRGYELLAKWKQRLINKRASPEAFRQTLDRLRHNGTFLPSIDNASATTNDPFFVYTSNVDAHFHRHFNANEIYELHGSVETWQCAGAVDGKSRQPCEATWRLPESARFAIDRQTMRADGQAITTCPTCGGQARPNVLMFHDKNWIANIDEEMLENNRDLKLVVLEIGCGMRVPSVRRETEMVVADAFQRCLARREAEGCAARASEQVTLIRVNPDFPQCDHATLVANDLVVSLRSTGLRALERLEEQIQQSSQAPKQ